MMEIKSFSFGKLIGDLAIVGGFVYSHLYLTDRVVNVYIWVFWVSSILNLMSAFTKQAKVLFTKNRAHQMIIRELTISLILVYFGYPVLATVGFISGLAYASSRTVENNR
ncbi:hypothetical protein GIJ74_10695 [Glaesserella parasuis]|uniref:hypothetical protein n=1 Tax=Glaesserella parasuis TaxID=738 RepID=UPI00135E2053|nr:hypothetical protein [Glaesserella parasuis]MDO9649795.1 hypothetical protein [Glaesserella parasuis]MDP0044433.1 hypothetical protein [Glaesserella parasuis]MDP0135941.1 hypothetical protein [Glaesserella parasuis]MDP0144422.1 hypothetical protein [Glaesserella parasuis]MDP0239594.1 hypothetical protein [Glaesserella parasuis]